MAFTSFFASKKHFIRQPYPKRYKILRKHLKINLIFSAPTVQIKNIPPLNPKPGQTSAKNSRLSSNSIIEFYEPSLSQFYCELRFLVVVGSWWRLGEAISWFWKPSAASDLAFFSPSLSAQRMTLLGPRPPSTESPKQAKTSDPIERNGSWLLLPPGPLGMCLSFRRSMFWGDCSGWSFWNFIIDLVITVIFIWSYQTMYFSWSKSAIFKVLQNLLVMFLKWWKRFH